MMGNKANPTQQSILSVTLKLENRNRPKKNEKKYFKLQNKYKFQFKKN